MELKILRTTFQKTLWEWKSKLQIGKNIHNIYDKRLMPGITKNSYKPVKKKTKTVKTGQMTWADTSQKGSPNGQLVYEKL